ncbi:glutathione S-transferase omega-1-like isoform X2 [Ahaetulla prasina]|uniref:glutathione S-transferase omega-1-like isoform X2 n=1 Tax=Ahaetulla prasina TaxID=499056 RepID=UPI0026495362|nr:glutathione S-transferase omega-1-like isoform X2 [Ahaetulla prasina]
MSGTPAPGPVPEGTIRVYSMRHCPFAQRTILVLKAKGINHEIVNINLRSKPEWFFEKNPLGMVPVLETSKGQLISESSIACEYLDEAYPGKKLYPADPYEKAYQKMILEYFSKLHPICFNYIRAFMNDEDASELKNEFQKKLPKLEKMLKSRKTKFFGGISVSMIDYLIWPWFERIEAFQLLECLDHTPRLKRWIALMKLDPAVQATITDPKIFKGFLELYFNRSLEACDYGL